MFKLIKDTCLNEQVENILTEGCCGKSKKAPKKCEGENPESFDFDKAEDNQEQELNFDAENEIENRDKYNKVTLANEESKIATTKKAIDLVSAMLEDEDEEEDFDGDGEDDFDPDELEALDIIPSDEDLDDDDDDDDDEEPLLGESTDLDKLLEKGEVTIMEMDALLEELESSLIELEGTTSEFETEDDGARIFNSETDDDIDDIIPSELDVKPTCSCEKCKKEDTDFMDDLDSFLEDMELDSLLEELDIDVYDERMFLTKDERRAKKGEIQAAKDELKAKNDKAGEALNRAGERYNAADAKYKAGIAANKEKYKAGKVANKEKYKARKAANFDRINKAGEKFDNEFGKYYDKVDANKADYKAKKDEIKARYKAKKKEAEDALKEAAYLAEMYEMLEGTIAAFESEIDGSKIYNTDTLDDIDQLINDVLDVKPVNRPGISGHANRGDSAIH